MLDRTVTADFLHFPHPPPLMKGYDETHVFKSFAKQKTYLEMEHTYLAGWLSRAKKSDHIHIYIIYLMGSTYFRDLYKIIF